MNGWILGFVVSHLDSKRIWSLPIPSPPMMYFPLPTSAKDQYRQNIEPTAGDRRGGFPHAMIPAKRCKVESNV